MMHLTHCLLRSICLKCIDVGSGSGSELGLWLWLGLAQWLKWSCEAGELTWRSQAGANPIPIPHPTTLALFGHKITLYRFSQGGGRFILLQGAQIGAGGLSLPGPLTLTTGLASNFGICTTPFRTNDPSDKWPWQVVSSNSNNQRQWAL